MGKIVGILSMQRVLNYGSFLQAYALKQMLLQNGAKEVHFIDIKEGKHLIEYKPKPLNLVQRITRQLQLILKGDFLNNLRDKKFMTCLCKSIEDCYPLLEDHHSLPAQFDLVVIGSDEVFNCCQASTWGYTLQLYGDIDNAQEVISYAGSFGHTTYDQLTSFGIDQEIGETMRQKLAAISVRDQNSYDIVKRLTGLEPQMHLDPVLIYGYGQEIARQEKCSESKYLLVYSYQGRIRDKKEIVAIKAFAKKRKLKLYSIYSRYGWCEQAIIPDTPFEVLGWFKNAEYVVTDTFHGTIFSLITGTKFATIVRNTNTQKLTSLLKHFGLGNRAVSNWENNELEAKLTSEIDWKQFNERLSEEREKSNAYICKFL